MASHTALLRKPITKLCLILQGERCSVVISYTSLLEPWGDVAMLGLPAWDTPGWKRSSEGVPEHKPWPRRMRSSNSPASEELDDIPLRPPLLPLRLGLS